MLFLNYFIKKFNNLDSDSEKINLIIKNLVLEYKIKDQNIIYIIESYNKQSFDITKNIKLIDNGRKKLIIKINKIKYKEFGIYQVLLNYLVKKLIEKNKEDNNIKYILDIYQYESLKITDNNNLIEKYRNILIIKLNENI